MTKYGDWDSFLIPILSSPEVQHIGKSVARERLTKNIYPAKEQMFNAFIKCPKDKLKVVILGQDPYPQKGVADGLAFSTQEIACPTSLAKLKWAIEDDVYEGFKLEHDNDLSYLAKQGVLLLNANLTVEGGRPGSHDWSLFTNQVISKLNDFDYPLVFIFFGQVAQKHAELVNSEFHKVFRVEHPASAAYNCRQMEHKNCFSETNKFLKSNYNMTLRWL